MRRTGVALGILGLVCALALPASAKELWHLDLTKSEIVGFNNAFYMQGLATNQRTDATFPPYKIRDGVLTSSVDDNNLTLGSDGVTDAADGVDGLADPPGVRFLLLTGDKAWADVSVTSQITVNQQNTGAVALVLRAVPKTKVEDTNSWYEFRYTTNLSPAPEDEQTASGILAPTENPSLRIMKVLNNKWSILAESTSSQTATIPAINLDGADNATGATFRFVAKGDVLQGFVSLDGTKFTKILEVKDPDLKAGQIGVSQYDYSADHHSLIVDEAP